MSFKYQIEEATNKKKKHIQLEYTYESGIYK